MAIEQRHHGQNYEEVKPLNSSVNCFEVLSQGLVVVYFGPRKDIGILYKDPTWPIVMEGLDNVSTEVLGLAGRYLIYR